MNAVKATMSARWDVSAHRTAILLKLLPLRGADDIAGVASFHLLSEIKWSLAGGSWMCRSDLKGSAAHGCSES